MTEIDLKEKEGIEESSYRALSGKTVHAISFEMQRLTELTFQSRLGPQRSAVLSCWLDLQASADDASVRAETDVQPQVS